MSDVLDNVRFKFEIAPNVEVDQKKPLIYLWEIHAPSDEPIPRYVGKSKNGADRPLKEYANNIRKLLSEPVQPYRKNNPNGYRKVHHALKNAYEQGYRITLTFLCNVTDDQNINHVEKDWISRKECKGSEPWQLNG